MTLTSMPRTDRKSNEVLLHTCATCKGNAAKNGMFALCIVKVKGVHMSYRPMLHANCYVPKSLFDDVPISRKST